MTKIFTTEVIEEFAKKHNLSVDKILIDLMRNRMEIKLLKELNEIQDKYNEEILDKDRDE